MKTILIMRHGEATPMQANDAARELTENGVFEAEKMGRWMKETFAPTAMLVSPYIRAQQTSIAVCKNNKFKFNETTRDIVPDGNPQVAIDYLASLINEYPQYDTWLLVTHMPLVSYLVDQLSPGNMPIFCTASVAVVQYNEHTQLSDYISINAPANV
ncbi:phosphohistidine phosphatase SixA [Pseudoalteromonas sp. MMG010]|uniref:phosphohistidine phosphatase SixA n=1 Tax=Pseudoalteromonas sp. MMG010 TaxID=2822685 RepID=UPI001B3A2F45|nr:phosphohistidine phosphatase SixA [Pseudoalteromonas sp. MMG010]MBQ4831833.1 phosphohistidine phosphatase SixA [Pseudoalteromonas sp. MMG010]